MDYIFHALKKGTNLAYLSAGLIAGLVLSIPFFWPAYLGLEVAYITYMANNRRFRRVVDSRLASQEETIILQRKKSAIRSATSVFRKKLTSVEQAIRKIEHNYKNHKSSGRPNSLIEKSIQSVKILFSTYIKYLYNYAKLDEFMSSSSNTRNLENEIEELKVEVDKTNDKIKPILRRKIEILEKRASNKEVNQSNLQVVQAQVDMLEETFQYLLEESGSITDLSETSRHVDQAMSQIETTSETMQELDEFVSLQDPSAVIQSIRY